MRIRLELDEFRFGTMRYASGSARYLVVMVGDRPFSVWRHDDVNGIFFNDDNRKEAVDKHLIEQMEKMLERILTDKCSAIPPGTNISMELQ